jgi:hypothetical protein
MHPIIPRRMRNQYLTGDQPQTVEEVVHRLGAVQSQDFIPGKWSIAQRTDGGTEAAVDRSFAMGTILRTHVLRPTWHFVLAQDIRWILALTAPRIHMLSGSFHRTLDLHAAALAECTSVLIRALEAGPHLTRQEIAASLDRAGIATTSPRLGAILMNAEINAIVCSGEPRGRQQTYALLDERAPHAKSLSHEEALAELTLRYFTGHGPASASDFRWWSSLTMTAVRQGLALVTPRLEQEVIDGVTYWFAPVDTGSLPASPGSHLVQGYDELIVGYGESKYLLDQSGIARSLPRARGIYTNAIILDGQVVGDWKPVVRRTEVAIKVIPFTRFDDAQRQCLRVAVERYGEFLGLPAVLTLAG